MSTFIPIALALATTTWGAHLYTLTDLGVLPQGKFSAAGDVSVDGQVVGFSEYGNTIHAFLWAPSHGMIDLSPASPGFSQALAINSSGQVAGWLSSGNSDSAFIWTQQNGIRALPSPTPSPGAIASDLNDQGEVVGYVRDINALDRAIFWNAAGYAQELGDLPGGSFNSAALDINNLGQIVGTGTTESGQHAVLWSSSLHIRDLGDLPGGIEKSIATSINDDGIVVGWGESSQGQRAFIWTETLGMRALDLTPALFTRSLAIDINSVGVVVGEGTTNRGERAFIWSEGDGGRDLNDLLDATGDGWQLITANAINDRGQIVGRGINHQGASHAFLLTPIPELSAYWLFLFVIGVVGALMLLRHSPAAKNKHVEIISSKTADTS
jgi:probable HAF family extracellular repeat protein